MCIQTDATVFNVPVISPRLAVSRFTLALSVYIYIYIYVCIFVIYVYTDRRHCFQCSGNIPKTGCVQIHLSFVSLYIYMCVYLSYMCIQTDATVFNVPVISPRLAVFRFSLALSVYIYIYVCICDICVYRQTPLFSMFR